ncbi:MAG: hypothetical protein GYB33_20955 [Gammaproteobacteria bacterium]|nr:hypothetical protein [Gammaproteobacteria bacterium]
MLIDPTSDNASLFSLLRRYLAAPADEDWCSATIVARYRSSYRKAGAMMLVDPLGHTSGLLSGGCLEADIQLRARKVMALGRPELVVYDSTEEDNIAVELGLGCNGRITVLIQQLPAPHRQILATLYQRLQRGQPSHLLHCFQSPEPAELSGLALLDENLALLASSGSVSLPKLSDIEPAKHQLLNGAERQWSLTRHLPPVQLWLLGGGMDAQPIARIAAMLGWQVTIADHRLTNARQQKFPSAARFIQQPAAQLPEPISADAAIVMTHNLDTDAAWLQQLQRAKSLRYIGLLGPQQRKQTVFELAGLRGSEPFCQLIHGPMGFDIGGDLPESVALSVLAQCHQTLAQQGLV